MSVQNQNNSPDTGVEGGDPMTRPPFTYAVVKFSEWDEELYNAAFDTADLSDPDAERSIARVSQLLDWQAIMDLLEQFEADGVSLEFRRIDEGQSWAQLQEDYRIARGFAERFGNEYESPEVESYYRFDVTAPSDEVADNFLDQLVGILKEHEEKVQMAYVTSDMAEPPQNGSGTQNKPQPHFKPASEAGIGIESFQGTVSSSKGEQIRFVDVEQGWILTHSDLPAVPASALIEGRNLINEPAYPNPVQAFEYSVHGMMVLGLIIARENGVGVTGISPQAEPLLSSIWQYKTKTETYVPDTVRAIGTAMSTLGPGDVILIEAQQRPSVSVAGAAAKWLNVPVEAYPHIRAKIKLATDKFITVIEAAGNNMPGISLDAVTFPGEPSWSLTSPNKSVATVVAAGGNADTFVYQRGQTSNYGTFIDCFADGDFLWVLNSPPTGYVGKWPPFLFVAGGATSSAAAIIAGVALIIQSHARSQNRLICPTQMRSILKDPALGTASKNATDGIGTMPDLDKISAALPAILNAAYPWP